MPAATNSYTIEALKGQAVTAQLKETVSQVTERVGRRIFEHALRYSGYVSLLSSSPLALHLTNHRLDSWICPGYHYHPPLTSMTRSPFNSYLDLPPQPYSPHAEHS